MPTKRCRYHKPSGQQAGRAITDAAHMQRGCCTVCGRSSWPLYDVEDVLLCESCERKYGLSIRADEQKTIRRPVL
jgi:hypothetical protein